MCTETVNVGIVVMFIRGRLSLETCQGEVVEIVIMCRKAFLRELSRFTHSVTAVSIFGLEYDLVTFMWEVGLSCNRLRCDLL